MSNLEVAEPGTVKKVRKGDIIAAQILSEWQSADVAQAADVAFKLGLIVSASLYPDARAEKDLHDKSNEFPSVSYSALMASYRNGTCAVYSAPDALKRFPIIGSAKPALLPANDNKRERFDVKWFKDIEKVQEKKFVIDGYIAEGEFDATVGKPGSGKSVIVTDAMCHVAAGRTWHGRDVEQSLVIYFAAERRLLTERRVAAFKKHYGLDDIPFVVVGGKLDLTSSLSDARALIALIAELEKQCGYPCRWITIDTLSRTFGGGDQNASKDMGKFVMSVDDIISRTKAHVTAIHHSPWNETRGKGAIDLDGAIDASFYVSKSGKSFLLRCDGTNDGEEGTITKFRLQGVELGQDSKGKATGAPIVVPAEGGLIGMYDDDSPAEQPLKGQSAAMVQSLSLAIGEIGQRPPIGTPGFLEGVSAVTLEQWQAAYVKQSTATPESAKKGFARLSTSLIKSGHVSQSGVWYWVSSERTKTDKNG